MEEIYLLLGRRIREERKRLGLSQEKLSFKARLSINFLGQIERGTKHPTLATADRIARTLGFTLSGLLKAEEPKPLPKYTLAEKVLLYHFRERTPEEKEAFIDFLKSLPSSAAQTRK